MFGNRKMYFIPYYLFFSVSSTYIYKKNNTTFFIFPGIIALNNLIYYYVSSNRKKAIPLKSRYGENIIISEEDVTRADLYEGYTIQSYMYLKYYSDIIDLLCILGDFIM